MRASTRAYTRSVFFRVAALVAMGIALPIALCFSISVGAAAIPISETFAILCGFEAEQRHIFIVREIRLPQALAAILAGAGLAVSGATMQSVLRNPLCSPVTLGISHAAAFGAALVLYFSGGSVSLSNKIVTGFESPLAGQGLISLGGFGFAMLATATVLLLARKQGTRSESIILIGVALNSLFAAGLMLLQYLADESQLTAIVYWTFGDTARAKWSTLTLMLFCVIPICVYFFSRSWHYNALVFGEETAQGLGVPVRRLRVLTMFFSSLLTAVLVSLLGVIGFVGLVVPHLSRLVIGSDHRFLLPFSFLFGGLLLLIADTAARLLLAPRVLPVSILTAFIGVPVFLSLLLGERKN